MGRPRGATTCAAALLLLACPCGARALHGQAADRQGRLEVEATLPLHRHVALTLGTDLRAAEVASNRRARVEIGAAFPWEIATWLEVEPRYRFLASGKVGGAGGVEHRYSVEAQVSAPVGPVVVENRNLLERRVEADGRSTRYRNRVRFGVPTRLGGAGAEWFLSNEAYYGWPDRDWTRNVVSLGLTRSVAQDVEAELAYLFQRDFDESPRDQHAVALGVDWNPGL